MTPTATMIGALIYAAAAASAALPSDIHPKSLSRLPPIDVASLTEEGRQAYDVIRGTNPAIPVTGPGPNSMYSPRVAGPFDQVNQRLRKSVVGPRYFELAALSAAREFDQAYEWTGHEPAGVRAGLPPEVIDAVKYGKDVAGLPEKDATVIRLSRALLRDHKVSSELWAKTVELFGREGAVDLALITGDYVMAGVLLTAVDQRLPPERPSTLPPK